MNHKWGSKKTFLPNETASGLEQTERICERCDITKITMHPPSGFPWKEWRHPAWPDQQFRSDETPDCLGRRVVAQSNVFGKPPLTDDIRRELAGKNLACWCALDAICHADVLLEIANAEGMA